MGNPARFVVPVIFVLVGAVAGTFATHFYRQQTNILDHWPAVEAQVVENHITENRSSKGSTTFGLEVRFRYDFDGAPRTALWSLGYSTSSHSEMAGKARQFAPGTRHSIRVNPDDPEDIRGNAGWNFTFFVLPLVLGGITLIFGGIGVGGVISWFRRVPTCPACGRAVSRDQNFCPHCAAPLTEAAAAKTTVAG